ncbi:nucleotide exchange factor GrpE [Vulgatibacter incomptus]|uniref:Protein GrpE n=1 Tax=Vulgatibacter incomptus TaxID=1391653 RepID=A0A0K1PHD7_9BACT|nr:nucleotide exchange factor GrpE [Vulgatibacter incomptus]AKU92953.1 Heat shock protein GrpE [Vulgatibacter incomptus]
MSDTLGPKGAFSADISDDAVAEALRAVEERETRAAPEGEILDLEPASDAAAARIAELESALETNARLLEESLQRGRDSTERLQEAADRLTRMAADFDNFRKRSQREKEEAQRFGIERLLRDLVPVLDNFDRALEHAGGGADLASFSQGVSMTRRLFEETLGRFGVQSFSAVGKEFDPRLHEAMEQVESGEHPANVVAREHMRGYLLHDRLVRAALVSVSRGPGPAAEAAGDGAAPDPGAVSDDS